MFLIKMNEQPVYSIPSFMPENEILIDPVVKNEMGKAGSFEFAIQVNNPIYNAIEQMKTMFTVDYDGNNIFHGRVLTVETDIWGQKKIHCEGAMAFLLDTLIMPTKKDERQEIDLRTYLNDLIDSHNSLVDGSKAFTLGEISTRVPLDEKYKFGNESWTSTLNCLEELISKYGGYFRVRHYGGTNYLDWLFDFYDSAINSQPIMLGKNLIDMSNNIDVNGIFTVLIPEGKKNGKPLYLDDIPKTVTKVPVQGGDK